VAEATILILFIHVPCTHNSTCQGIVVKSFINFFYTSSKKLEQSWEKTDIARKTWGTLQSIFFLLEKFTSNITCSLESGIKHHKPKPKQIWSSEHVDQTHLMGPSNTRKEFDRFQFDDLWNVTTQKHTSMTIGKRMST